MYVVPEARGTGVARALLEALQARGSAVGCGAPRARDRPAAAGSAEPLPQGGLRPRASVWRVSGVAPQRMHGETAASSKNRADVGNRAARPLHAHARRRRAALRVPLRSRGAALPVLRAEVRRRRARVHRRRRRRPARVAPVGHQVEGVGRTGRRRGVQAQPGRCPPGGTRGDSRAGVPTPRIRGRVGRRARRTTCSPIETCGRSSPRSTRATPHRPACSSGSASALEALLRGSLWFKGEWVDDAIYAKLALTGPAHRHLRRRLRRLPPLRRYPDRRPPGAREGQRPVGTPRSAPPGIPRGEACLPGLQSRERLRLSRDAGMRPARRSYPTAGAAPSILAL